MSSCRSIAVAAVVLVAVSGPVHAQQPPPGGQAEEPAAPAPLLPEPEGFTVTPFVDVSFSGDLENSPAGFGVAGGYGINNRVSVEADISFIPDADQGIAGEVDASVWSFSGNALYHFLADDVTPYVTVGVGMLGAHTNLDDLTGVEDDTDYELAWNWGGGLKTVLNERFGFRGDFRYFNGDDLAPDHWRLYGGLVIRRIGR